MKHRKERTTTRTPESDAEDALKRAKEILEGELKLKLSTEKTKIINARKKGVEFLGFHFNGRWKRPRNKARKRFREEIRRRTRRQQTKNLEIMIKSINPVIRGWGNYFKCGMVKKSFGELDGYAGRKLHTGNPSVQFDEEVEAGRPLLYSTSV